MNMRIIFPLFFSLTLFCSQHVLGDCSFDLATPANRPGNNDLCACPDCGGKTVTGGCFKWDSVAQNATPSTQDGNDPCVGCPDCYHVLPCELSSFCTTFGYIPECQKVAGESGCVGSEALMRRTPQVRKETEMRRESETRREPEMRRPEPQRRNVR